MTKFSALCWLTRQALLTTALLTWLGVAIGAPDASSVTRFIAPSPRVSAIPMIFEANSGQAPSETKFIAHSNGGLILIRPDGLSLMFSHPRRIGNRLRTSRRPDAPPMIKVRLIGSRSDATVVGDGPLAGKINYFIGRDPHRWIANIPTFHGVIVRGAWPGIDALYAPAKETNGSGIEISFIVHPGAEPSRIRLSIGDSGRKPLLKNGAVEVRCGARRIVFTAPHVVEEDRSGRFEVASRFIPKSEPNDRLEIDLRVARHKPSARLIVDPTLTYSTFLGGSGEPDNRGSITGDVIRAIALDATGNEYVAGAAASLDFPSANTAFLSSCSKADGCYPAFVTKLDGKTGAVVYSTFLGGGFSVSGDSANAIAVDNGGEAYVAGVTHSNSFPTTPGVVIPTCNGDCFGVPFATKLSADGSSLVFSTLLSANNGGSANGIAIDGQNKVYVGGTIEGNAFATVLDPAATQSFYGVAIEGSAGNALAITKEHLIVLGGQVQFAQTGRQPAFLAVLDPSRGSTKASVRYARTFGTGRFGDYVNAIAIDSKRHAWAVGVANDPSSIAPSKFGSHKHCSKAAWCGAAFLLGVDIGAAGRASLAYSAEFGGNGVDSANAVAVDDAGTVYVGGQTSSTDFPVTTNAVQPSFTPCEGCKLSRGAAFVMAIKPGKARPLYSTYLGGAESIPPKPPGGSLTPLSEYDAANALAFGNGLLHAAGVTFASVFPITSNANQPQCPACAKFGSDGFVARINPEATSGPASLVYSSFLGGSGVHIGGDNATSVAMDASGAVYVTGLTTSVDFPVTPGASQPACAACGELSSTGVYSGGNAFVVKLNPAAPPDQQLIYATYLGGSVADDATSLAVDPAGEAYVVGQTSSPDFPLTPNAFQSACSICDAFFSKLDATGSKLLYSGAFASGIPTGVAIDPQGNALVVGGTSDKSFPITANALQHSCAPCGAGGFYTYGGFLSKIDPTAIGNASLVYSSFLSGSGFSLPNTEAQSDWMLAVASDPSGRAVLSGAVSSFDFPVTANALQSQNQGYVPAAVLSVIDTTAQENNQLVYSTYFNGSRGSSTKANAVVTDSAGRLYIGGFTSGNDMPTTPNSYSPSCPWAIGCASGFVAVIDPKAPVSQQLVYGSYLGGKSSPLADDTVTALGVDSLGLIYAGGHTFSTTFPVTSDALEPSCLSCPVHADDNAGSDGFFTVLDPSASGVDQLVYSTYLGGINFDVINALSLGPSGQVALVGHTGSTTFPTTANALQRICPACFNAYASEGFVSVFQF